jgi:hypothetical protein
MPVRRCRSFGHGRHRRERPERSVLVTGRTGDQRLVNADLASHRHADDRHPFMPRRNPEDQARPKRTPIGAWLRWFWACSLFRPMPSFASLLLIALSLPPIASASEHRSRAVAREFQREHPCPSTGLTSGACPGYWKDHIVPLACGGPDTIANMQWQTIPDARGKDKWERSPCAR